MNIQDLIDREELVVSSRKKRFSAMMIDDIILSVLLIIILFNKILIVETTEEIIMLTNHFMTEFIFIKILYQTFFIYQYGATLGKRFMKIKVISLNGANGHTIIMSFSRAVFRIVSELLFYLGFLWGLLDSYNQTWHDKLAKTLVIDDL